MTLSGGEPTMQPLFAKELLSAFQQGGIHTALDTCGQCSWETLEALLPYTDMVLYDLKEIDPDKHKKFTGVSNTRILENLIVLGRFMKERGTARRALDTHTPDTGLHGHTGEHQGHRRLYQGTPGRNLSADGNFAPSITCASHKYESLGIDWALSKNRPDFPRRSRKPCFPGTGFGSQPRDRPLERTHEKCRLN